MSGSVNRLGSVTTWTNSASTCGARANRSPFATNRVSSARAFECSGCSATSAATRKPVSRPYVIRGLRACRPKGRRRWAAGASDRGGPGEYRECRVVPAQRWTRRATSCGRVALPEKRTGAPSRAWGAILPHVRFLPTNSWADGTQLRHTRQGANPLGRTGCPSRSRCRPEGVDRLLQRDGAQGPLRGVSRGGGVFSGQVSDFREASAGAAFG